MNRIKNRQQLLRSKNKSKKTKSNSIKQLLRHLKAKPSILISSLIFGAIGSLIYSVSGYLLGSFINSIFTPDHLNVDDNFSNLIHQSIPAYGLIIILLGMYLLYLVFIFFQNWVTVKISQITSKELRWQAYCRLQQMPVSYFDTHSSGDLMSRMTNDIDNISQALTQGVAQFVQSVAALLFTFIIMMVLSPYLTLITLSILFIMMIIGIAFAKKAQPHFTIQQKKLGILNGYVEEVFSGHKAIRLLNSQTEMIASFRVHNEALVSSAIRSQTYSSLVLPWLTFVWNITYLSICAFPALFKIYNVPTGGIANIDIAFIISFIIILRNFLMPIQQLLLIANLIQAGSAGAERVFQTINLLAPRDKSHARALHNVRGYVNFEHVNFGYTPEKLNLIDANITAKPGEVIAIVGPTGAGKTTIINLLTKFYNYNDGKITIDNHEIQDAIETTWRDNIAIVLQDTYLFSTSIKENIRYGKLNASDDEIIAAAKIADAHDFIMQLENGYETIIESNGRNFSHGERQLLAIARAIIRNSPILVLDEATSSVDTRTEMQVQSAMLRLMKGRTSFVIAHRLSTIKNATIILVVNDGKIIERGTHNELMALNGFYTNMVNSQFKKGVIEEV